MLLNYVQMKPLLNLFLGSIISDIDIDGWDFEDEPDTWELPIELLGFLDVEDEPDTWNLPDSVSSWFDDM